MDFISKLRGIESRNQIRGRAEYRVTVDEQKKILSSLDEPADLLERSDHQYVCQKYLKSRFSNVIFSIGAFLVYPVLKKKYASVQLEKANDKCSAIFLPDGKSLDIVPDSLKTAYSDLLVENEKRYYLSPDSIVFLQKIEKRFSGNWLFKLKLLVKAARYGYLIERYSPKALIVCNEYSFTSSAMSMYCKENKVELINVMHGEKLFSLQEAFFSFPKCYVWNEYYISLFNRLRAQCDEYIVELPKSMIIPNEENKTVDYTYYLQEETGPVLRTISENLKKLKNKGFTVAIRPHPRYTDRNELANIDIEIEDVKDISIQRSLGRTKCAISFCSTVLNQAFFNGIDIVIDDVARPEEYKLLLSKEYIMTKVDHKCLSQIMADNEFMEEKCKCFTAKNV